LATCAAKEKLNIASGSDSCNVCTSRSLSHILILWGDWFPGSLNRHHQYSMFQVCMRTSN
jgi:hypothetical protein